MNWKQNPASAKQLYWINKVGAEKVIDDPEVAQTVFAVQNGEDITAGQASVALDYLFSASNKPVEGAITEPGMYEHEGDCYKVVKSKTGNLYAKVWVNTPTATGEPRWHLEYAAGAAAKLTVTEKLSIEAEAEWNKKTGYCSRCNYRLSDPESLEKGFGPTCWKKVAWMYSTAA